MLRRGYLSMGVGVGVLSFGVIYTYQGHPWGIIDILSGALCLGVGIWVWLRR